MQHQLPRRARCDRALRRWHVSRRAVRARFGRRGHECASPICNLPRPGFAGSRKPNAGATFASGSDCGRREVLGFVPIAGCPRTRAPYFKVTRSGCPVSGSDHEGFSRSSESREGPVRRTHISRFGRRVVPGPPVARRSRATRAGNPRTHSFYLTISRETLPARLRGFAMACAFTRTYLGTALDAGRATFGSARAEAWAGVFSRLLRLPGKCRREPPIL
jgi:hypothetical protein